MKGITFKRGQGHWKAIYQGAEVGVFHDVSRRKGWAFEGVDDYMGRGKTRLKAIEHCISERKRLFSLADIKELNREAGNHFFSKGAMGFFNSRMATGLLKGGYFVTSEKAEHSARAYTVRKANYLNGSVDDIGGFQAYRTIEGAKEAIRLDRA